MQVLDARVAEIFLQLFRDFFPAQNGDKRKREIGQRIRLHEGPPHAARQFLMIPAHGDAGRDDGAHAGAADDVEGNVGRAQCLDDADMRKASRAAACEHEADGAPGQHARKAGNVAAVVFAHIVVQAVGAAQAARHGGDARSVCSLEQQ